jgi:2-dehydro-3-deoxygalactonokinase
MKIFLDWGSSNFRAFLFEGKVLDQRAVTGGGTLKNFAGSKNRVEEYSSYLKHQIRDWIAVHPKAPIYICGAVGGREGWVETVYSETPASLDKLRHNLYRLKENEKAVLAAHDVYIATGCATLHDNRHDVMRGEEVKAIGAALHLNLKDSLFCIPGTHCKWVEVKDSVITRFETCMTGEIYNLVREKGALAAVLQQNNSSTADASFMQGVALASEGRDTLNDLWQVRAQFLRNPEAPEDLSAYLSGILIGHEALQMKNLFGSGLPVVLLMDDGTKKDFYSRALQHFGWKIAGSVNSETAVCHGLSAISA